MRNLRIARIGYILNVCLPSTHGAMNRTIKTYMHFALIETIVETENKPTTYLSKQIHPSLQIVESALREMKGIDKESDRKVDGWERLL
jgi:hypothetical protein